MGKQWTSIRITAGTLQRLREEVQLLLRAYGEGLIDLPNGGEGFSLDALVNRLLDAVQSHRARGRLQRQRRKEKGQGSP